MNPILEFLMWLFLAPFIFFGAVLSVAIICIVIGIVLFFVLLAIAMKPQKVPPLNTSIGLTSSRSPTHRSPKSHACHRSVDYKRRRRLTQPATAMSPKSHASHSSVDYYPDADLDFDHESDATSNSDHLITCDQCQGTGVDDSGDACPACGGEGRI